MACAIFQVSGMTRPVVESRSTPYKATILLMGHGRGSSLSQPYAIICCLLLSDLSDHPLSFLQYSLGGTTTCTVCPSGMICSDPTKLPSPCAVSIYLCIYIYIYKYFFLVNNVGERSWRTIQSPIKKKRKKRKAKRRGRSDQVY